MKLEKFESIVNNYVNGNLSDFRKQIKKLSKIEILDLLLFVEEYTSFNRKEFTKRLKDFLRN